MIAQIMSALARACLVAGLVVTPALLLPASAADMDQIVVVIALLAAFLTFMEYYGRYPSIVEFRFAQPFNRLKFAALALGVISLSLIMRGKTDPTLITALLTGIGDGLARIVDFPYSPVRLMVLMLPADASAALISDVRIAAGVSYAVSICMIIAFVILTTVFNWPMRGGRFNVWINLPLFDPTRGGDVVERLRRDAGINIVLGVLLPFLIPTVVKAASGLFDPVSLANPQTLIWTVTAWAFFPGSMLVRGIALMRVADLIEAKRRRVSAEADGERLQKA